MHYILSKKIKTIFKIEQNEIKPFVWSFIYFFSLMCSYYILRPVRDEMGIQGGIDTLQWMFSATFAVMLLAVPVFGWIVKRYSRTKIIPLVYSFFIINLLLFYILFQSEIKFVWIARIFFIWVSVFNLFVISIFWSFMNDIFTPAQARRMFASIAAGGSAGAILGPAITVGLSNTLGLVNLILFSVFFLLVAIFCVHQLVKLMKKRQPAQESDVDLNKKNVAVSEKIIGGSIFSGIIRVMKSPYLSGISIFMLFYSTLSTFLYFEQAYIIKNAFESPEERTALFATMDLAVNVLTVLSQVFLTSRLVERFGLSIALMLIPFLVAIGFGFLGFFPILVTLVIFQIIRRAGNYAITRPAREMLYTVLPVEDKYKSKNFIDTVVYRGGDVASGWIFSGLKGLGIGLNGISFLAIPIALLWGLTGFLLGREQKKKSENEKSN